MRTEGPDANQVYRGLLSSWEAKIAPQQLHRLSLQCITDSCTPTPAQLAVCRRTGLYGGLDAAPVLRPDR